MADVYTLILAGGVGSRLGLLTEQRAKPAVPFGGKYRIIDFVLSNCANSGLHDVGLLTQYRPQSLIEHVGIASTWDMDRSMGGLNVLQPEPGDVGGWYGGTADAVYRNLVEVVRRPVEDVLILSGDHVYGMDYRPFLRAHRESRAAATVAATPVTPDQVRHFGMIHADAGGRITAFEEKPETSESDLASMGVYLFRRDVLVKLLREDAKTEGSRHDFGGDLFPRLIRVADVGVHRYEGYWRDIGTLDAFFAAHQELLDPGLRTELLPPRWPIRSPSADAPPVRLRSGARFHRSMAANGAVVGGTVERSILFPGVHVEPGAEVRDSILMGDVTVEAGARVERAILDKRTRVGRDARVGGGGSDAPPNRQKPGILASGLTLSGKDAEVGEGARIGRNVALAGGCRIPGGAEVPDGAGPDDLPG
jgi:glucose-1-phosphate adenylyltransferase